MCGTRFALVGKLQGDKLLEDMNVNTFPGPKFVSSYGIVCFSHLRWNFVFQRPQHLLSRFAKKHDVLLIEEPIYYEGSGEFVLTDTKEGVRVAVPHIPYGTPPETEERLLKALVTKLIDDQPFQNYIAWYYTP